MCCKLIKVSGLLVLSSYITLQATEVQLARSVEVTTLTPLSASLSLQTTASSSESPEVSNNRAPSTARGLSAPSGVVVPSAGIPALVVPTPTAPQEFATPPSARATQVLAKNAKYQLMTGNWLEYPSSVLKDAYYCYFGEKMVLKRLDDQLKRIVFSSDRGKTWTFMPPREKNIRKSIDLGAVNAWARKDSQHILRLVEPKIGTKKRATLSFVDKILAYITCATNND